jgi:hypothetical protein
VIKNINRITICLLFGIQSLYSQVISPFNGLEVTDSISSYSFIVSGHFHGSSTNQSTFPASTLLAGIDTLNSLQPAFLMSLGDLFLDVDDNYISHYNTSLFSKLRMPLLNAVGNHDLSNGNLYEKKYGKTWYTFRKGYEYFVVLNTEIQDGSIKDGQLELLTNVLNTDFEKEKIRNIFIFSHRPVWAENNERYKGLFTENTHSAMGNNYAADVLPLLKKAASKANVFWISGSMGGGPASFFYDKDENGIFNIVTAIRDLPRDGVLQVKVSEGKVDLQCISLTGEKLKGIETYNRDFWKSTAIPEERFNLRLLPLLILKTIKHIYFWSGVVFAIVMTLLCRVILRRWRRKK